MIGQLLALTILLAGKIRTLPVVKLSQMRVTWKVKDKCLYSLIKHLEWLLN